MHPHSYARQGAVLVTVAATMFMLAAGREFRAVSYAQGAPSIWDGVYTEAQAERGKTLYMEQCAACHGDKAQGDLAPPLIGDDMMLTFADKTVEDLFNEIQQQMPANDPGKLTPPQVVDLIAFLSTTNKWPAGEKELPADPAALKLIRIIKTK